METPNVKTCGRCGEQGHHHHDCHRIHEERRIKSGVELITTERERQMKEEGWTPEHDDQHRSGEMVEAAIAYAVIAHDQAIGEKIPDGPPATWPWEGVWWKPSDDAVRNLVKAGALIAAEIDRLQRANSSNATTEP